MEKFFKTSLLLILGFISPIFVACNDDDPKNDEKDPTLVGVWVSDKMPLSFEDEVIGDAIAYCWYQKNGKFVEADCIYEDGEEYIELSENGTWKVENGILTQTTNFEDDDVFDTFVFSQFSIKGNSLFLTFNEDGEMTTAELKRSTVEVMQNIIEAAKKQKLKD